MSGFSLKSSIWNSKSRPSASEAVMLRNNNTSLPSGVATSTALEACVLSMAFLRDFAREIHTLATLIPGIKDLYEKL